MLPRSRTTPTAESGRSPPSAEQDRLRLIRQTSPLTLPLWALGSSNRPSHRAAASLRRWGMPPISSRARMAATSPPAETSDRSKSGSAGSRLDPSWPRSWSSCCDRLYSCVSVPPGHCRRSVSADSSLSVSFGFFGPHLRKTNWRGCNGPGRGAVHGRFVRRRRIGDGSAIVVLSESLSLTK